MWLALLIAFSATLPFYSYSQEDEQDPVLIYDNIFNTNGDFFGMDVEFGDEVALSGTARQFRRFEIEYFGKFVPQGKHKAIIRFYANDGTEVVPNVRAPGSLLFESPQIVLFPGRNALTIESGTSEVLTNLILPNVFTWTIEKVGFEDPEEEFGIFLSDPIRIGQSFKDFWAFNTDQDDFRPRLFTDRTPANFSQRIYAIGGEAGTVNEEIVEKPFSFTLNSFDEPTATWDFLIDGTQGTTFAIETSNDMHTWQTLINLALGDKPIPLVFNYPLEGNEIFFRAVYSDPQLEDFNVDLSDILNGNINLEVIGNAGLKVRIEWTSTFDEWRPLINLTVEEDKAEYLHELPIGTLMAFYRVIVLP